MRNDIRGFTLIEALIALLVLTVGLLGAASMLLTSVRNSHNSYLRSQASFMADSLLERMRANPFSIWRGDYNGALDGTTPAAPVCGLDGCTPQEVASFDRAAVAQQILQHLPNGRGDVLCEVVGAAPVVNYGIMPVNGSCRIEIRWDEKRDVEADTGPSDQMFELVVQP